MTRIVIGALTSALLVGLALPAHAANREHQQLMADIRMLQEQSQQLQLVLASLADTLKTLNTKLDDQSSTSRKQFADQKLLIDNLSGDLGSSASASTRTTRASGPSARNSIRCARPSTRCPRS